MCLSDFPVKTYQSLASVQKDIADNIISCVSLVQHYLDQIEARPELNAFIEVYTEQALAEAARIDQKIAAGTAGRLAGMVLGLKDVLCHKGHELTASSKILKGFKSLFTATAVQRLLDEDVIVIGRLSCDEFAMGSSNENAAGGAVRNPLNTDRVPGGSSGGSAAAVAGGLCLAALGSDTGGSVRQPASFCGIVGLKPTYGRISRWGLIAYASSFDQIGPLTHSIEDAALLLEIMAGPDGYDNTASSEPLQAYTNNLNQEPAKRKIGYIQPALDSSGLDPEIKDWFQTYIDQLKAQGHTVEPVDFPYLDYVVPCYYTLTTAEASSNLSRYDGVRYGHRTPSPKDLQELYVKSRTEGFGKEVKRRIMLGTFVLSAGYYDAYYTQAMKVRRLVSEYTASLLSDYDFLLSPTTPGTAFSIGAKSADPIAMYLADIYTVHANLSGNPAISLPLGLHSDGMPFGVQIMGQFFGEADLLAFSQQQMKAADKLPLI